MSSGKEVIVEDDSDSLSYYPPEIWEASSGVARHGNSYHGTHGKGASVTLSFNGSYIAYYSDKHIDHGDFSASIDGKSYMGGNSYAPSWVSPSVLLFSAELDPGTHTLTLTNSPNGTWLGLDYFLYHASPPSSGNSSSHATPSYTRDALGTAYTSTAPARASGASTARGPTLAIELFLWVVLPLCAAVPSIFLLRARRTIRNLRRQMVTGNRPITMPAEPPRPPPYDDALTDYHVSSVTPFHYFSR